MADASLQKLIARSCKDLLLPVVRLLLKSGITWKDFCEVARLAFVEVATSELGTGDRPGNISRVAILTGMTRREVRRQRDLLERGATAPIGYMTPVSGVLSGWHNDPEFVGPYGKPRDLPLDGPGASFASLVRRYGDRRISVAALLKELQGSGALVQLPDGRLRAHKRAFVPRPMEPVLIRLWASGLRDVGTTLEYNVTRPSTKPSRFERRALNLNVDRKALPAFRQLLEVQGEAFLETMDDWLTAHQMQEGLGAEPIRLGVGVYHIEDARVRGRLK